MIKKLMIIFIALTLMFGLATGCAQPEAPEPTPEPEAPEPEEAVNGEIVVGSVMCLSGALGPMGEKIGKAVELAVEEINEAGGVNGKMIRLITEDDATESARSLEAVRKLVEVNGANFIVGPMTSGSVDTVGPFVSERQVLLISPSSTAEMLTGRDFRDYVFRTTVSDGFQGRIMAQLAVDEGVETAVIFTMDNTYGVGLGDVAQEALEEAGVEILANIKYDEKTLDYLSELAQIGNLAPDVVIHVGYNEDGKVVYRQALEAGLEDILWVAPDGIHGAGTLEDPSAAIFMEEAVIGTRPVGDTDADKYLEFVEKYEAAFGFSPDVFTDTAYDAMHLLALAMEEAGSEDPTEVREALLTVADAYEGASGTITLNEGGDRISGLYEVWEVVDGQNVQIKIIEVE